MPFRFLSIKRAVWAPVLVGLFISCCHPVASFSLVPCIKNQFTSTSSSLKAEDESNTNKDSLIRPTASIRVIYESDDVLAVHKPPHISHHDDPKYMGILSCVRELQKEKEIAYQGRLWGVHRLDRVTSGVLLFAKSQEVAQELAESFREKKVTKYYVALTNKKPKKKKQGWVKGDMMPSRRKSYKLSNTFENPAITRFFTAGLGNCDFSGWNCSSAYDSDKIDTNSPNLLPKTMILFHPHTGKTHQLRVAAKSLGVPILGDLTYSDAAEAKYMERAYLHSLALHVVIKGENIAIYNPPNSWFNEGDDKEGNGLADVLASLMKKHCDCEDLIPLI